MATSRDQVRSPGTSSFDDLGERVRAFALVLAETADDVAATCERLAACRDLLASTSATDTETRRSSARRARALAASERQEAARLRRLWSTEPAADQD